MGTLGRIKAEAVVTTGRHGIKIGVDIVLATVIIQGRPRLSAVIIGVKPLVLRLQGVGASEVKTLEDLITVQKSSLVANEQIM